MGDLIDRKFTAVCRQRPTSASCGRKTARCRWKLRYVPKFTAASRGSSCDSVRVLVDRKLFMRLPIRGFCYFLLGSGLAGGLSTSLSWSVILTSRKQWFAPLPRPGEAAFPMVGAWVRVGRGVEADTRDLHWSPKFGWSNLVWHSSHVEQFKSTSY